MDLAGISFLLRPVTRSAEIRILLRWCGIFFPLEKQVRYDPHQRYHLQITSLFCNKHTLYEEGAVVHAPGVVGSKNRTFCISSLFWYLFELSKSQDNGGRPLCTDDTSLCHCLPQDSGVLLRESYCRSQVLETRVPKTENLLGDAISIVNFDSRQ